MKEFILAAMTDGLAINADGSGGGSLDILVVAAHPDDAEISVGGTIASCVQQGLRVGVLDLTSGEPTPHGTLEIRGRESEAASQALGLLWRRNLGLPNRSLEATLTARRALAEVFREVRPQMILTHHWDDAHPDHRAASELVDAARFWAKLTKSDMLGEPFHPARVFYYTSIHLRVHGQPAFVVNISDQMEAKMKSVKAYESQLATGRPTQFPTVIDEIRDCARYWGWAIHRAYGEPFYSREAVGVERLFDVR